MKRKMGGKGQRERGEGRWEEVEKSEGLRRRRADLLEHSLELRDQGRI